MTTSEPSASSGSRRLGVLSLGFLWQQRLRRILSLAGWDVVTALPGRDLEAVGVWGRAGVSWRGRAMAKQLGLPLITLEDPFMRSLLPGKLGESPQGLIIDDQGIFYDATTPSRLETILATGDFDEPGPDVLTCLDLWRSAGLSKYNAWAGATPMPPDGFVLVIDQTHGDASIAYGMASEASFTTMLDAARDENPGTTIVVRTHPDVVAGKRRGCLDPETLGPGVSLVAGTGPPSEMFRAASRVYCVTSQLGFEAILHNHRPRVFGAPFYAGWTLSDDEIALPRRGRPLSVEALFEGAMLRYPTWYGVHTDRLTDFPGVARTITAQASAWRVNATPVICSGVRLWKRPTLAAFLKGPEGGPRYCDPPARGLVAAQMSHRRLHVWASKLDDDTAKAATASGQQVIRVEDGFLRSSGLGAALVPPASLVFDDIGIYYDPRRESRLERLIASSLSLEPAQLARAERLCTAISTNALTKYNIGAKDDVSRILEMAESRRILLVPGQVEDDASIRLGCTAHRTNLDLLVAAREANPDAFLIYKPHPDVETGLRIGQIEPEMLARHADQVAHHTDPASLIDLADCVWTLTSLLGFEAMMRGVPVTVLGMPFYAGWGLTEDLGASCPRRVARPTLAGLIHAALIDYPRYIHPHSGLACTPEDLVAYLSDGADQRPLPLSLRLLNRAQHRLSRYAQLWR